MFEIKMYETPQDRSADAVDFIVGRGAICSYGKVFNVQTDSYCNEELGNELWSIVGQKIRGSNVWDDLIIPKYGHCSRLGYRGDRYGPDQSCISVCQDN